MARLIWTEKAIADLEEVAEFIAIDDYEAARRVAKRVIAHVDQLSSYPLSGSVIATFPGNKYRQIIQNPCRIIYRYDRSNVIILRAIRTERLLRISLVEDPE